MRSGNLCDKSNDAMLSNGQEHDARSILICMTSILSFSLTTTLCVRFYPKRHFGAISSRLSTYML